MVSAFSHLRIDFPFFGRRLAQVVPSTLPLVSLVVLFLLPTPRSEAATLSNSDMQVFPASGGSQQEYSLQKFDPGLGRLNGIVMTHHQTYLASWSVANPTVTTHDFFYSFTIQEIFTLDGSFLGQSLLGFSSVTSTPLAPNTTTSFSESSDGGSSTFAVPSELFDAFVGDSFVRISSLARIFTPVSNSACGPFFCPLGPDSVLSNSILVTSTATITYDYTPVPEPTTTAGALLLAAVVAGRRKKLSQRMR